MAKFSVEGDEDGNEEGPSNRRLRKKRRTSDLVVDSQKKATTSISNSGDRASHAGNPAYTSDVLQIPLVLESRPEKRANPLLFDDVLIPPTFFSRSKSEEGDDDEGEERMEDDDEEGEERMEEEDEEEIEDDGEEIEHDVEEGETEQQTVGSGDRVQPTEAQVNSTPNGNGKVTELVERREDALAPLSVTLTDPDVLDCPICFEPLNPPVYQCENGHISCASCCTYMMNKCPCCCWPIGYNRCRAIEKVLESIRISCRNMQHGCQASLSYSRKLDHENQCIYDPCSCPHPNCTYIGFCHALYSHFSTHSPKQFRYDSVFSISLGKNQKHAFLQEKYEKTVFVLNRCIEPLGSFVNVVCIAPTSWKRKLVYEVSASDNVSLIKLKTVAKMTPQWTGQRPEKKYVIVPNDFLTSCRQLKLELTIRVG